MSHFDRTTGKISRNITAPISPGNAPNLLTEGLRNIYLISTSGSSQHAVFQHPACSPSISPYVIFHLQAPFTHLQAQNTLSTLPVSHLDSASKDPNGGVSSLCLLTTRAGCPTLSNSEIPKQFHSACFPSCISDPSVLISNQHKG